MSTRRSRFKVAASIPVRRKPQVVEATIQNTDSEPREKIEQDVDISNSGPKDAPDDVPITYDFVKPPESLRKDVVDNVKITEAFEARGVQNETKEEKSNEPQNHFDGSDNFEAKLPTQDHFPKAEAITVAPLAPPPVSPIKAPRSRFVRPALSSRRPSVHASSASESEDDSQRQKVPKLVDNKVASENHVVTPLPPEVSEVSGSGNEEAAECARLSFLPKKKAKVSNFVRKVAEARREFKRKFAERKPDRSNLKMFDLIFYNPNSSPLKNGKNFKPSSGTVIETPQSTTLEEEEVDNPDEEEDDSAATAPVPQVKIGANGEIILDEKSLVIETTASKKGRQALESAVTIHEEGKRKTSYYGKKPIGGKEWSPIETKIFYRALNCLGTDFALMHSIFPNRTRSELKNKFKREERNHGALVDRALSKPGQFNVKLLLQEVEEERKKVTLERNRQLEEKYKMERDRKVAAENKSKCVQLLEEFVGAPATVDTDEFARVPRRPRRAAQTRRYMHDDYVDPFAVSEEDPIAVSEGCTEDPLSMTPPEEKVDKRKLPLFTPQFEVEENNVVQRLPKRGTVFRVTANVQKKPHAPEPVDNADTESVVSCLSVDDIPAEDFMELLQDNIQNSGRASIRVEDTPAESNCALQVVLASGSGKKSRRLRVLHNVGRNQSSLEEHNFTINEEAKSVMEGEHDYASELETVYTLKPLSNPPCYSSDISPQPVLEDSVSDLSMRLTKEELDGQKEYAQLVAAEPELEGTNQHAYPAEEGFNYQIGIEHDYANRQEPLSSMNSVSNSVEPMEACCKKEFADPSVISSTLEQENEDYSHEMPCSSQVAANVEGRVSHRMTGGFQYAHIESNSTPEQTTTCLAGLRPGSFVFMTTSTPDMPQERKCSMYMMAEKLMPDGNTVPTPMPVVLPPELMSHILSEMDCQSN